jgi:hypothetical protein
VKPLARRNSSAASDTPFRACRTALVSTTKKWGRTPISLSYAFRKLGYVPIFELGSVPIFAIFASAYKARS